MAAGGAVRVDQFRLAEPAQEVLRAADDFRGAAHGVCGVVLVVQHVVGLTHATSKTRAPAQEAPGPRVNGSETPSPTELPVRHAALGRMADVRGSRKRDRRTTSRSMETAVSAPSPSHAAGGGRSNGVRPSLSSV